MAERPVTHAKLQVLIAHNPHAGARPRVAQVQRLATHLEENGWCVTLVDVLNRLSERATALSAAGELAAVVAAGGDGTVAAVANRTPLGTPLIVYPLGTENLIAKYFGYNRRPAFVAELLTAGHPHAVDAGLAGEKLFVLMISAGFDAEVVRRVAESRAGHIRRWTYAKPLLSTLRTYRYPALRLLWTECASPESGASAGQDQMESLDVRWIFGMNLSKYAFGLNFAPAALGTDGLLDVCTFSEGSLVHVFRYAWGVLLRRHLKYRDARLIRCRQLRIEVPDGLEVPYQLDGDFGGYLPVDVRVLPGRLRFLIHPRTAERLKITSGVKIYDSESRTTLPARPHA